MFQQAAQQGWARALNNLGSCCEKGIGVKERNMGNAFDCYQQATKSGDVQAMFNLGVCSCLAAPTGSYNANGMEIIHRLKRIICVLSTLVHLVAMVGEDLLKDTGFILI